MYSLNVIFIPQSQNSKSVDCYVKCEKCFTGIYQNFELGSSPNKDDS